MIERTFQDIPKGTLTEADQQSFLASLGWSPGTTWQTLLRARRVLIVSEAGAGKTYECRRQAERLRNAGEPAFFIELSALARSDLQAVQDDDENAALEAWILSQSDIATFFLDSVDELKLSQGSFEAAIKRFKKNIGAQLARARIVITTRPIPFDAQLVRRLLPIPPASAVEPREESFAKVAMRNDQRGTFDKKDHDLPAEWRSVGLMPLSDEQITQFARTQGIHDAEELLADLRRRNAQDFARRPQDLIELCADWREHRRIRTHWDQVNANVRTKLQPRDERSEPAELSLEKAIEGAGRLALAMLITRRVTIRHSAASDDIESEAPLNPATILSDWTPSERKALLERPLFGFASYGRVRFHHRSVAEFLAAQRLQTLRERGMSFRALKRILFSDPNGTTIVRPSKRPLAGWLALMDRGIFELLRNYEPAVLLNEGDPASLAKTERVAALRAYVERYGKGGWRGLSVPYIQIHRFASGELATEVQMLWREGVENPEVRQTLLELVEAGQMNDCADLAHAVTYDDNAHTVERAIALNALVALRDPRLDEISAQLAAGDALWTGDFARHAILQLFPRALSVKQLCRVLAWLGDGKRSAGDLIRQLPRLIQAADLTPQNLEALRDGLVELISEDLCWSKRWPHIVSARSHLSSALAATCLRGLDINIKEDWLRASALALRVHGQDHVNDDSHNAVRERLESLDAEHNACLFWAEDALVQALHQITDPWRRLIEITGHDRPVVLNADRDLPWIKEALNEKHRAVADRAMLLEAAMRLPKSRAQRRDHLLSLKPSVEDQQSLLAKIDEHLKPSKHDGSQARWERKKAKSERQRQRRLTKDRAKWICFWRSVSDYPDDAFSPKRGASTAWNLWVVMRHDGEDSRTSGWNRRFIESHFGKDTADRLRLTLTNVWRNDRPTLARERPAHERSTFFIRWQLGLAAIYAEAEDSGWATKLNSEEAKLAARYAPIEISGLPSWIEALIIAHPDAVDETLGSELTWELQIPANGSGIPMLLQSLVHEPEPVVRAFIPRLWAWLRANRYSSNGVHDSAANANRIRQVISVILKHGNRDVRSSLLAIARDRLNDKPPDKLDFVWLPVLMGLCPESGVTALDSRLRTIQPAAHSEAVSWFCVLFGERADAVNLRDDAFTAALLLKLLRLAYQHVRPEDDVKHEDAYTPDTRDEAERGRQEILRAFLDSPGEAGWQAKLELAGDPLFVHFKDRIISLAEEVRAQEIDSDSFDESQVVMLDRTGELPASTNEAMFALMVDRLADLDDFLLRDTSPWEAWAGITSERVMRREIARTLAEAAAGVYKVDQEAVTADEKETDIRLRSTVSDHEAVIELKLADNRTAKDLRGTIHSQLVRKYMAAENSRSGCLLITLAKDRKWYHPDSGSRIGLDQLMQILSDEAERVEKLTGGEVRLKVHFLDLRPRLPLE